MPKPSPNYIPKLTRHKASNRGVVRLDGTDRYCGRWPADLDEPPAETRATYDRLIAEWLANGRRLEAETRPGGLDQSHPGPSVNEVLLAFWNHAQQHYRDQDGRPTSEVKEYRDSLRPVRELYDTTPAAGFSPLALKAIRQQMINAGVSRGVINRRVGRVKRAFKWVASEELVPVAVYQALATVSGLAKSQSQAREAEGVEPVSTEHVSAVLPFLNRHVRAMLELQQLTGMRPGEVCKLKLLEVDRSAELWVYRPERHKTAHRGKSRLIPLGPKTRALLVGFLVGDRPPPAGWEKTDLTDTTARLVMADAYEEAGRVDDAKLLRDTARPVVLVGGCVVDPDAPVFSPAREREERFRTRRERRKTKVQPSQVCRRKTNPKRVPAPEYSPRVSVDSTRLSQWI